MSDIIKKMTDPFTSNWRHLPHDDKMDIIMRGVGDYIMAFYDQWVGPDGGGE